MGDSEQTAADDGGFKGHLVGAIQVFGGLLEITLGAGAMGAPTGVTQVAGVILIAHGADTIYAGFNSIYYGNVHNSFTQRGATALASKAGASPQTAQYIGAGADIIAGVGPSVAIGVTRRLAVAGAETAADRVAVGYLHRGALTMGHNTVGIQQGGVMGWVHFAGRPLGEVGWWEVKSNYAITQFAVTAQQAARAAAARDLLIEAGEQTWSHWGPNCTTVASSLLREAGIVVPAWSRTPLLLHIGVNAGAEITMVGGGAAATAPLVGRFQSGQPPAPAAASKAGAKSPAVSKPIPPNAKRLLDALPPRVATDWKLLLHRFAPPLADPYGSLQWLERAGLIRVTRGGFDELNIRTVERL